MRKKCNLDFTELSDAATRPRSAFLRLAMMGCPALRARGELAAGACAPLLGWDRSGPSSAEDLEKSNPQSHFSRFSESKSVMSVDSVHVQIAEIR